MQRDFPWFPGACTLALALMPLGITGASQPARADDASSLNTLYSGGLTNLKTLSRYFTPAQAGRLPTLQAILHRVVYEPDQATDDEMAIGIALITGKPVNISQVKGGMGQAILALHFKPLVAAHAGPAQVATAVSPVARTVNTGYTKIAGAGKSVTYTPGVARKPGGGACGYVDIVRGEKRTRIVEIPSAVGELGLSTRAAKIAHRMASVQQQDPAWWSRIAAGQATNGESVVRLPNGPVPYIVTADTSFAREWNTTPPDLAKRLVTKIRTAIQTSGMRGAVTTPQDEAIQKYDAGNDAYSKGDVATAEQLYKQATEDYPSYVAAYKALVGIYKEQKKTDEVKGLLVDAEGAGLTADQVQEIRKAAQ